jgi:hypothetical protein
MVVISNVLSTLTGIVPWVISIGLFRLRAKKRTEIDGGNMRVKENLGLDITAPAVHRTKNSKIEGEIIPYSSYA